MPLPNTYLLGAPSDARNPFGEGMLSSDIIRGLKQANGNVVVPLPEHYERWYPGKKGGITCVWVGPPGAPTSVKVCALRLGMVPEFTQLDAAGDIIDLGWRAVLEKAIRARVASRRRLERIFKVNLNHDGKDKDCAWCRKEGVVGVTASHGSGLCDIHEDVRLNVAGVRPIRDEWQWNATHPKQPVNRVYSKP